MIRFPHLYERQIKFWIETGGRKSIALSSVKGKSVTLNISALSSVGITSVKLHTDDSDYKFVWKGNACGRDIYTLALDDSLTQNSPHFKFEILLLSGKKIYYVNSTDKTINDDSLILQITEDKSNSESFVFTVTDGKTPKIKGAVYHIFTDRFNKTSPIVRSDSRYDPNWESGIPEYTQVPGEHLENNTHFGGSFDGIEEKLEYIKSLSVEYIYLSPVSKAYSNHKYDVGDYFTVDECLGGEEKLKSLIRACHRNGIKVIIDSVFNHTGDDSVYFNKYSKYDSLGAYQSSASKYYDWYTFGNSHEEYNCWWGVKCLPSIKKGHPEYISFVCGEGGVIDYYMNTLDADGVRLDVTDELTLDFIKQIKVAVKRNKADGIVIGEVWENATRKIAYDEEKYYFDTGKLDSVTNYPLMNDILEFVKNSNSYPIKKTIAEIYSDYPIENTLLLFNILSTHDTWRALTRIGAAEPNSKNEKATYKLSGNILNDAKRKMKLALMLQAFLPGVPCIYYGDEIGMQGFEDPFCRMPMKWDDICHDTLEWYKKILLIRKNNRPLYEGGFKLKYCDNGIIIFDRFTENCTVRILINASQSDLETEYKGFDLINEKEIHNRVLKSLDGNVLILP